MTGAAVLAWLSFLHAPMIERIAAPCWPIALVALGTFLVRAGKGT